MCSNFSFDVLKGLAHYLLVSIFISRAVDDLERVKH